MELEELKSLWNNSQQPYQPKDPREIALMLHGKSKSIVDKLKRNVWLDLGITLCTSLALLVYAMTLPSGAFKWTSVSILFTLLLYPVYYIKKLAVLNRFVSSDNNIRTNIEGLISTLSGYLGFYSKSYIILYPVFFVLFLVFIGIELGTERFLQHIQRPVTIVSLLMAAVIYYIISTRIVKWILNKLYGKHLAKLQTLLNDIHAKND